VTSPTPSEILTARQAVGFTQTQAAALVHSALRTWQQWEAGDRAMHPGLWELFAIKLAWHCKLMNNKGQ
jgi:DNA-binding transcriptional regulator YiaG